VAVLGAGKIGSLLALGFRDCGADVVATARRRERAEQLRAMGLRATLDNVEAVRGAQIVVVSVKPYQYPALAKQVGSHVAGKAVVSVMAGIPLRLLRATLRGAEVYRAMPNLNVAVKRSVTGIVVPPGASYRDLVLSLFRCVGSVYEIPEQLIDAWTAVAGSGPAMIAELVDAMMLGALAVGIPRHVAYDAILETLAGTAEYLRSRPEHPAELRDEVTTPGGTTIRALKALEAKGMKSAIIDAIEKATTRAKKLAREIEEELLENGLEERS
jgi:pyrroline-5-carboxylate reductase